MADATTTTTVEVTLAAGTAMQVRNGRDRLVAQGEPDDAAWMPTELFLAGLGSCMLATLVHAASVRGIDAAGAEVRVTGETVKAPTRFGTIRVAYRLPPSLGEAEAEALVRAASRCKVHNTITGAPLIEIVR